MRGVRLLENRGAYEKMQGACRSYVLEHCDQAEYMEKLTALYQELIDSKKETR